MGVFDAERKWRMLLSARWGCQVLNPDTSHINLSDKMTDVAFETKCCTTNLLNYSTSNELLECAKCAVLEFQLQQVRDELSSIQLIIQLLNKERVQGTTVATPIQAAESRWEVDKDWEIMTQRGEKKGQKVILI